MGSIGLLGGSFNPVHFGHLRLARAALDRLPLEEIRFIPAGQPWQKASLAPAGDRVAMLRLALAGEPRFSVDPVEIERAGPTYTIDTLRELRARLGADAALTLVMGGDQWRNLDTWREWRRLPDFAHLAVARRDGARFDPNETLAAFSAAHAHAGAATDAAPTRALAHMPAGALVFFDMPPTPVSATEIRALLALPPSAESDRRLAACLPAPVLAYIRQHALYQ
jgi:nicotinate-nucleotide adenylyltransferase